MAANMRNATCARPLLHGSLFYGTALFIVVYYVNLDIIISDEIFQLSHVKCHLHYSVPFKKIQNVNQVFSQIHVRVAYLFLWQRIVIEHSRISFLRLY